jgi:hypothetical protein
MPYGRHLRFKFNWKLLEWKRIGSVSALRFHLAAPLGDGVPHIEAEKRQDHIAIAFAPKAAASAATPTAKNGAQRIQLAQPAPIRRRGKSKAR